MNIDTNNAFSGKVKFLQGGGGVTIVNNVVPLIIPSNLGQDGIDFVGSVELPLNVTASVFDTTLQNTSFIPNENIAGVLSGFKVWFAKSKLQFVMTDGTPEDTLVQVTLEIDGVGIDIQAIELDSTNGYESSIDFDLTGSPTLIETSIKFLVEAFESGGEVPSTKSITIPSTTTILYSNEYSEGRYYGFLSSYLATNFIIDDTFNLREIGFGGSYFSNTSSTSFQNVSPFDFSSIGIYVVFSAVNIITSAYLTITLIVNGVATTSLTIQDYTLQQLIFVFHASPISINQLDELQLRVRSNDASGDTWQIQEIGLVYRVSA
jgi:hypothetical protein